MNQTIFHRGPDDDGFYEGNGANLAMRRLSIVDLGTGGQPISNEDGTIWVVFNGEIYNHQTLRHDLIVRGHRFKTSHSDTETIVHLYEEYGPLWPHKAKVNGMFGLALWDSRERKLLLYRDRIGKKPLYYALAGGELIFGSEIKAVLAHPAVTSDLDFNSLSNYFSLKNTSAPATAFKNVRQLMPGHYLSFSDSGIVEEPYWTLNFSNIIEDLTPQEAAQELTGLLDDAVRLRMQCDAPFGAYLSGGVDSSSVVALMCRHHHLPIKTFCLGYEDKADGQFKGKGEDIKHARAMSRRLHTDHHEYILTAEEFARRLPEVLSSFDEPFSGTVSTFFLSILIHKHVKVALTGDGADELFGSYLSHRLAWPMHHFLEFSPRPLFEQLSAVQKSLIKPFDTPQGFAFLSSLADPRQERWRSRLFVFDKKEKERLFSPLFAEQLDGVDSEGMMAGLSDSGTAMDPLNRVLEVDQRELLANQVLPFMDRLSMAHSIEARSPFLDYRIIEFANRLPGDFKINQGINKYVHKLAVEKLIPKELIERPKEGFVQPVYSWMRGSLRAWVEATLSRERLARHGFLNYKEVDRLVKEHLEAKFDHSAKIWSLLCFQTWYEGLKGKLE